MGPFWHHYDTVVSSLTHSRAFLRLHQEIFTIWFKRIKPLKADIHLKHHKPQVTKGFRVHRVLGLGCAWREV